jgi:hypothetical protein
MTPPDYRKIAPLQMALHRGGLTLRPGGLRFRQVQAMKFSAASCLLILLLSAGSSRADDATPTPPPTATAPAAAPANASTSAAPVAAPATATGSEDEAAATSEAREQLLEAQRMADAALQSAGASSNNSPSSSGVQSQSEVYYPSASVSPAHHTMGELLATHLGPDYSDPHHHSMGALVP